MGSRKKLPPIHPVSFAIFPILFLYSQNKGELLPGELLVPIIGVAILTLLFTGLWFLLSFVLKSKEKAAFLTSALIFLFYSYGHFYSLIKGFGIHLGSVVFGENKILYVSYTLVLLALGYFLFRTKRGLGRLTTFVNLVALSLVLISIIDIIPYEIAARRNAVSYPASTEEDEPENIPLKEGPLPDIYYIILDGYARNDTLKKLFNYDNSEFTEYLEENGFYVTSKSNSNYALTTLSLASALRMDYLNRPADALEAKTKSIMAPLSMIEDGDKVVPLLKSYGYKFINLSSGWWPTETNKNADINLGASYFLKVRDKSLTLSEFSIIFLRTTALKPFLEPQIADSVRWRFLYSFEEITKIPNMREPTFTFAHYNMPHPPYLFDRDGNPVPKAELQLAGGAFEDREHYLDQLIFASKKAKEIVDAILSKSENPPIIIIQADHGSPSLLGSPQKWASRISENAIRERMAILNAYYLPHGGDVFLYDSITPVNTFRLIFNFYFGANYELLPDETYFSYYPARGEPVELIDVTEIVNPYQ